MKCIRSWLRTGFSGDVIQMHYVIIGRSAAGVSAAKAIRNNDGNAIITLISAENGKHYYRPSISLVIEHKDHDIFLNDTLGDSDTIKTIHDRVTGLDISAKEVKLASGNRIKYDKVLIATGSGPIMPEVPGIHGAGVFSLRSLEDARMVQSVARERKHAVVLGGGFAGIKAAIALKKLGLTVTIIEKLDRILSEKLDRRGASMVADLLRRADIDIALNQQDYEINRVGVTIRSVRLASGRIIDADLIVVAVGTKPCAEAFRNAGIRINRGILIDDSLQTTVPDVYAAGDVVEYIDILTKAYAVSGMWANAEEMGRLAGNNMAGTPISYPGFLSLMNTVDILDVPVTTIGMIDPDEACYEVFVEDNGSSYRKLVFKDDVMKGALFIGSSEGNDVYTYLIKNRIPVGKLRESAVSGSLVSKVRKPAFAMVS